jgi:hypothetical protein
MFYIVNPKNTPPKFYYFLENMSRKTEVKWSAYKKHYKLVYHDDKNKIYGCAFLSEKHLSHIIGSSLLMEKDHRIWALEEIFFTIENETIHESLEDFHKHWCAFYKGLLETLETFAFSQGISQVYLHLDYLDYGDVVSIGQWPMAWSVELENGMTFSQMALTGSKVGIKN